MARSLRQPLIRVVNGSSQFEVPSSNPLRLDFFGILTLDFHGYFRSLSDWSFTGTLDFGFDIGIASASFHASLTIGSGDPFHFHFEASFNGSVLGGLASFGLTGFIDIGGGGDGLVRLGGSVTVTLDFFFFEISFNVPFEFTFGRLNISLPPVLAHVEPDGTLLVHMGADAGLRLRSNNDERKLHPRTRGRRCGQRNHPITALGVTQDFANVRRIVVRDAGIGSDTIIVKSGVVSDAEINGGSGDDSLTYSGRVARPSAVAPATTSSGVVRTTTLLMAAPASTKFMATRATTPSAAVTIPTTSRVVTAMTS